jgi:hypothetical protein
MDDQPMPDAEDLDDMPTLEEAEDEDFHSLMEDALMETLPTTDTSSGSEEEPKGPPREPPVERDTSSESEEEPPVEKDPTTPLKPPVEFTRFALEKAKMASDSPLLVRPKPFVLRPPQLQGPAQVPQPVMAVDTPEFQARLKAIQEADRAAAEERKAKSLFQNPFGKKSTRSNTKIEGDPTRVYLPTRTSKKK